MLALFARRVAAAPDGSKEWALLAACVIGVFGMLRRSNLVPDPTAQWPKHLRRADITVDERRHALRVLVYASKTIQYRERVHELWIQGDPAPAAPLDPVRLWQSLTAAVPAPPEAPAFCYKGPDGPVALLFSDLADGIKSFVRDLGYDPAQYSTHSLRRGGATFAVQAGVPALRVRLTGDWRSEAAFQRYVTLSANNKLDCTATMLRAVAARFEE